MNKRFKETSRRGAIGWLMQRITAVLVFVLLMIHYITYHFLSGGKAPSYERIIAKTTTWWFPLVQFTFLLAGLWHGLYGTWIVIEDYVHHKYWRILLFTLLATVGTALMFVGTLTIIKAASLQIP